MAADGIATFSRSAGGFSVRAMILAAGRGERLRPLTDYIPKPLIDIAGQPLIAYHLRALATAGIHEVVINIAYLANQIRDSLRDGQQYGLRIHYSYETSALETGGGILQALPLFNDEPFIVVNGDVWTDYNFAELPNKLSGLAHLVLVNNPPHHHEGDFALINNKVDLSSSHKLTFSGIAIYHPKLFTGYAVSKIRLATILQPAILAGQISGEHYPGVWMDIGTPERLAAVREIV